MNDVAVHRPCRTCGAVTDLDGHLAGEELFSGVAINMRAQEDAPGEGFAAVGAHVGQSGAGPVLQQLGRRRQVCRVHGH